MGSWAPVLLQFPLGTSEAITVICSHICTHHRVFSEHRQYRELGFPSAFPCVRAHSPGPTFRWHFPITCILLSKKETGPEPHVVFSV